MNKSDTVIEVAIREQAIHWFVLAQSGLMDAEQRAALESWRYTDARHDAAWQRLVAVGGQLRGKVGADIASATLQRADTHRRRVVKVLAGVGLFGVLGWQLPRTPTVRSAFADFRTATGERRTIQLTDGTQLMLNTASAVDITAETYQQHVVLKAGEVAIATSPGSQPLLVDAGIAQLRPLGTRFMVRRDTPDGAIWLAVTEGRVVANSLGGGQERIIEAGQGTHIDSHGVADPQLLTAADTAWTDGVIVANRMRLADFLAELNRYRPGVLRCDPLAAEFRLTGAYPIDNTDSVLDALAQTLPVHVIYRSRWWVSVAAS